MSDFFYIDTKQEAILQSAHFYKYNHRQNYVTD